MTEKQIKRMFRDDSVWWRGKIDDYYYTFTFYPETWAKQKIQGRMNLHVPTFDEYENLRCIKSTKKRLFERERKNMITLIMTLLDLAARFDEKAAIELEDFKQRYGKETEQ